MRLSRLIYSMATKSNEICRRRWVITVCLCKAMFTLLRFHLDPFLLPKTGLFFFPVHTISFSDRNGYQSIGVHICPQNRICLTASVILALLVAFSNCSVFGVHTTEFSFCLAPFLFSSVFIIVFIWFPIWGRLM